MPEWSRVVEKEEFICILQRKVILKNSKIILIKDYKDYNFFIMACLMNHAQEDQEHALKSK